MADTFPEGELIFDALSKFEIKMLNRRSMKNLPELPYYYFGINNPIKQISKWSNKIQVKDWFTLWARTHVNPNWNKKTLKMIKRAERFKTTKIIHLKFTD